MKIEFIDVKYKGEIELTKNALKELSEFKNKKLALYTTTQFFHGIKKITKQLENYGIKVVTSQPERTSAPHQSLGCDIYHGNLNFNENNSADFYLYVGDGMFHPNALLFHEADSNSNKPVFVFNPKTNKLAMYNKKHIEKVLKKKQSNTKHFLISNKVGIIVSIKWGQSHVSYVKMLKEKFKDKEFYVFICDAVNFNELENFPFIQTWINTACPRIGMEDALNTDKCVINAEEVLRLI